MAPERRTGACATHARATRRSGVQRQQQQQQQQRMTRRRKQGEEEARRRRRRRWRRRNLVNTKTRGWKQAGVASSKRGSGWREVNLQVVVGVASAAAAPWAPRVEGMGCGWAGHAQVVGGAVEALAESASMGLEPGSV